MSAQPPRETARRAVRPAVRPAVAADSTTLAALLRDFAEHEGIGLQQAVTGDDLALWMAGPGPAFEALIVELDGAAVGYLAFYRAFSLFKGGPVLLVENLFVTEAARGLGLGRSLLAAAAREAEKRAIPRMELHVRADSRPARAFYEALGLVPTDELVYRLEDDGLARLAAAADRPGLAPGSEGR